jgi:hypothetical protein
VAVRVRFRAACGVCGGQNGIGAGFLEYFGFPCQSSFHQFLHHHNHPGLGTIGLLVAAVPSGPNWTPLSTIPIKKNLNMASSVDDDCNNFKRDIYLFLSLVI